jgi:hypothetical protein
MAGNEEEGLVIYELERGSTREKWTHLSVLENGFV